MEYLCSDTHHTCLTQERKRPCSSRSRVKARTSPPLVPELIDGAAYALLGMLAPVLLALLFQHSKDTEGPGEPRVVQGEGGMIHVY